MSSEAHKRTELCALMRITNTYNDPVSTWLIEHGYKVTRKNWLQIAYMGDPPEELEPEEEAELPEELQKLTIFDLIFLRQIGVGIDAEEFANVRRYENQHLDVSSCSFCRSRTRSTSRTAQEHRFYLSLTGTKECSYGMESDDGSRLTKSRWMKLHSRNS